MEPVVIDTELSPLDWDALQQYVQRRAWRQTSFGQRLINGLLAGVAALLIVYLLSFSFGRISGVAFAAATLVSALCYGVLVRRARRAFRPKSGSIILQPLHFEIDAHGIRTTREHQAGAVDWRSIESIDETAEHVFLPLDPALAYAIPKRQIVALTPDAFVAQLRQWHAERRGQGASPAPSAPLAGQPGDVATDSAPPASLGAVTGAAAADAPWQRFWSDLRSNLLVGVQVFFFRRVQPARIVATFDQIVALLLALLAVASILDRATAGAGAEFNSYGVYTWIALLLAGLWVCALVARSFSARADTRTLLAVALATAPWVVIATTLLGLIPVFANHAAWHVYAAIAIVLGSSLLAIRAAYGSIPRPARIVLAASMLVFASVQDSVYFDTHLWTEASDDDESLDRPSPEEAEAILFDQQARIDEAVEKLAPQRPGVADLYYVGFAGDGYQRVFRRESLLGQRTFAARLGSGPRSLELINDYQDRESFPLATRVSLRYALSEVGKAMDPDEDVLVLFLTSHGSREGGIYIRDGVSWTDSNVPPSELRSALDDAGIRWRIVIVSACYSGVFVEPLKTDTTMILTAADSQHTSFGCADDRDLTYFGEAFLQDAMPTAPSLQAAFERARKEIADREAVEKLTASNPQMWVGASMAKKLAGLGPFPLPGPVAHSD